MTFRSMRFDTRTPRRSRRFPANDSGGTVRAIVAGGAIAMMLIGIAVWYGFGAHSDYVGQRDKTTLCLLHRPTPHAELTLLDQTDALAAGAGQRFTRLIRHIRDTLPRDGRLIIVPFGGDLGRSLEVTFDVCSPGRGSEANELTEGATRVQREYVSRFEAPLDRVAAQLSLPLESERSPITAQVMRAVNDPSIGWQGQIRVLNILTDGLENTDLSKVYKTGAVQLTPPSPNLLRGVTVNYYEMASARHSALQTPEIREAWKQWFEAAGATVNMYAPGYAAPAS